MMERKQGPASCVWLFTREKIDHRVWNDELVQGEY